MYDIIVVGGGHAGIEAALVSARMGKKTLLITMLVEQIGAASCNPAIGDLLKGIWYENLMHLVVRWGFARMRQGYNLEF